MKLHGLKEQLVARKAELERELRKKEKLDQDLKESRAQLDARAEDIKARQVDISKKEEALRKVNGKLREETRERDRLEAKMSQIEEEVRVITKSHTDELAQKKKYMKENEDTKAMILTLDQDLKQVVQSKEKIQRQTEKLLKDKGSRDIERMELEKSRNALKAQVVALQARVQKLTRQEEADAKAIIDMLHERDILNKNSVKADERTKEQMDLVKRHGAQANNLTREVQRWKAALRETLKRENELRKQNEKYNAELSLASGRFIHTLEELKARDAKHAELKNSVADVKQKLSQQKNLYEAVRTDRNLYSKNWLESNDEIAEMKRKFRSMSHQIEALKEEIKEAEQEQQNQRKEFDQVTSERNILGTQLIRRNDELSLLYEKIKIQKSTLDKGETQYK